MSEKKFQRFGKYLILDHLVDGGMAKICRARYLGEQANKVVAIKMVQPQFSNDETFVRMFQDELNITFGMLHPNIMQVYDYGKTNGQLYTAMEYIHGANLKQYLDRLKERKVVFPVEISCHIISQVCLGLHYAHTFTDKLTGKPYHIVHRDISPHNIMLTYDGAVKVIDFGIAKANTNSEATQAGTIKGKLSYLAPEYLDGMELDARYDEFAVGITLWEMLCSRKLFQANNDLAVLKQIQACKITPPSEINPSVPKELDFIVMKALSKDRSQRYENLDQLNRALVRFLYSRYPDFNASDLKMFADDLFKQEIVKDREKFVEYGSIDVQGYIEELKKEEQKSKITTSTAVPSTSAPAEARKYAEIELPKPIELNSEKLEIEKTILEPKTRKARISQAKTKPPRSSGGTDAGRKLDRDKTASRTITRQEIIDFEEKESKSPMLVIILVASLAGFAYLKPDLVEEMTGFKIKQLFSGEENTRVISSEKPLNGTLKRQSRGISESQDEGKVILSGIDVSMEVLLDGKKSPYVGRPFMIPLDQEVLLMVKKKGHLPFTKRITLSKEDNSIVIVIPELERSRLGRLTSTLNYTAGSKLIYEENGELVERDLPFDDIPITEGTYQARVVNPILGTEKKVEFKIIEDQKHFLE